MKKRITCLVLLVLFVAGIAGSNGTFAWFVAAGESNQEFTVGEVSFTLKGNLVSTSSLGTGGSGDPLILPNQELLDSLAAGDQNAELTTQVGNTTYMYLTNASTVASQLRIKAEYTLTGGAEGTLVAATDASTCPLELSFIGSDWYYSSGYFYFGTLTSNNSTAIATSEDIIPMLSSVKFSGDNTMDANAIDGANVYVRITFEARQSDYVNWTTVGTIST